MEKEKRRRVAHSSPTERDKNVIEHESKDRTNITTKKGTKEKKKQNNERLQAGGAFQKCNRLTSNPPRPNKPSAPWAHRLQQNGHLHRPPSPVARHRPLLKLAPHRPRCHSVIDTTRHLLSGPSAETDADDYYRLSASAFATRAVMHGHHRPRYAAATPPSETSTWVDVEDAIITNTAERPVCAAGPSLHLRSGMLFQQWVDPV